VFALRTATSAVAQAPAREESGAKAHQDLRARLAAVPPKIDGVLDDELWSGEPLPLDKWMSYNPLRGEPEQQRTSVWIGYDSQAIYFAFRCYDAEPDRIRSTISRRDNVWNDDWVGVSLDSSRAGQIAYHMFVNPSGIQMDALQSANEDTAPDWLWQSAGKIDAEGYVVEIRLPLQSIRFRGGNDVRMGMLFFRRNRRLGISWSCPAMKPGEWVFEAHAPVVFGELKQPLLLEVIPSATYSHNEVRSIGGWQDPLSKGELGASLKYGITSTMTLDATVNPTSARWRATRSKWRSTSAFPSSSARSAPSSWKDSSCSISRGREAIRRCARRCIRAASSTPAPGSSSREPQDATRSLPSWPLTSRFPTVARRTRSGEGCVTLVTVSTSGSSLPTRSSSGTTTA